MAKTGKKSADKDVDTVKDNPLVQGGDQLPDYINKDSNRGNENVSTADMVVPRIEIVQALSPCLDENDEAAYIPGAKQGMLFNSLTRKLYGHSVIVVPIQFSKQWLLWRDRDKGGGFRGAHESLQDAETVRKPLENPEEWEPVETAQHLVLIARADGEIEEAMVSMARTKLKVSRQWNSMINMAGGDRFSRAFELSTVQEQNTQGQKYYNLHVKPFGFPTQPMYEAASEFYEKISTGELTVEMDTSDTDQVRPDNDEEDQGEPEY